MKAKKLKEPGQVYLYIFIGILALLCILPFVIIFVASISDEAMITKNGFSLLPQNPGIDTYEFIVSKKGTMLIRAFLVTITTVVAGTIYTVSMMTCYAYAIAQKKEKFRYANALSFFAWFTTVFGGGILPWYILCTKYYGLQNNLAALFIPYGMNVFFVFILKNNFKAIPHELLEAAEIDGASNAGIFFKIALPLAKVGIVTVLLFTVLQYWNDFHLSLYLISSTELYTLQKLLYNLMANASALLTGVQGAVSTEHVTVPTNTVRMAMTMITVMPIMIVYPFAQKYFVRGMTIGAIKG